MKDTKTKGCLEGRSLFVEQRLLTKAAR